jgi:hypothetical protein
VRFEPLALILMLALAAPVGAALSSLLGQDLYLPRNLAVSWPALGVALAALLAAGPRLIRMAAITLVVGAFAFGAIRTVSEPTLQRTNYRDAAALVDQATEPSDVVLDVAPLVGTPRRGSVPPPALTLDVHLDDPHVNIHYITPPDGRRALREARGHKLALVGDPLWVGPVRAGLGLDETTPIADGSFAGAFPTVVEVYAIPDDRAGSAGS